MARHILAVDLGTTALKVALVDTSGRVVRSREAPCQVTLLPGGGAEQDPSQWWRDIADASSHLMSEAGLPPDSVVAVCCSAQWSGTVAVDAAGEPIRNAIIWMDARGAPYVRDLVSSPVRVRGYGVAKLARWIRRTGGAPAASGKDPLAHILWLAHTEPDTFARTWYFLEPKDWLNLRLTGRAAATTDSIALHWVTDNRRIRDVRYDPALLRMAGLREDQLPPLIGSTDICGPLLPAAARALGVPAGIPVVAGSPDVQTAAIGSGATRDYQPHLYIGTSSWLTCHVPRKKTDLLANIATLPSAIPGRYFVADEQETAGAALDWVRKLVLGDGADADAYARLEGMAAASTPGSGGVIFTPWLYGERSPVEDGLLRGGFHNLALSTTRADMVRAVFEGVALNSRWLLTAVERFTGRRLEPIRFIGGGARSALWCQIIADVLGREVDQVADPVNAGVRGAGMLAAVALGDLTFREIPDRVEVACRYRPQAGLTDRYSELFGEFVGLYKRNHRAYARLNGHHHTP